MPNTAAPNGMSCGSAMSSGTHAITATKRPATIHSIVLIAGVVPFDWMALVTKGAALAAARFQAEDVLKLGAGAGLI